jgi:quercetin dioxygenase-like cupin family protein
MRHFVRGAAESRSVGPVDVARWEQYFLGNALPFQAMWYSMAPGITSPRDCHPEVELSIVIDGTASVEVGGEITEVRAGSAFLLGSEEPHIIHNRSAGEELLVFSAYWMPGTSGADGSAALDGPAAEADQ